MDEEKVVDEKLDPKGTEDVKADPKTEEKEEKKETQKAESKGLTATEVAAMIQAQREKWEEDQKEKERIGKLPKEDQEKELIKQQQMQLDQKEKELARKELTIVAVNLLDEKQLPTTFKDIVVGKDEAETKKNVEAFEKSFRAEVDKAVTARLSGTGTTPKKGDPQKATYTKEDIDRMTPDEINKNWEAIQASL